MNVQGVWPSLDLVEVYVCRNSKTPDHIIWLCVNWIWCNLFHLVNMFMLMSGFSGTNMKNMNVFSPLNSCEYIDYLNLCIIFTLL